MERLPIVAHCGPPARALKEDAPVAARIACGKLTTILAFRGDTHELVPASAWRDLEVRPAGPRGLGLFAKRAIPAKSLITVVEGTLHQWPYDDEPDYGETWYGVAHQRWIEPYGHLPARYVNHACEPNAVVRDGVRIAAALDIAPGEEITIDYGTTEEDPGWSLVCACGSPACRGIIRARAVFPQ